MAIPQRVLDQIEEAAIAEDERVAAKSKELKDWRESTLGKATYSWANPLALQVKVNSYNAKNIPFSEHGIGIANYGWNEKNIFKQLDRARAAHTSGDKSGGYRDIYKHMMDQVGTFSNQKQGRLFKKFLITGRVPKGLKMDTIMQIADYGLRANVRKQQRKTQGFFSGNIGAIIGAVGGAAIGFAVGGPGGAIAGAKAGGAAGGVGQAINEDRGLLGTAMAGIGGYGIGSLGATMGATAANTAAAVGAQTAKGVAFKTALANTVRSGFTNALQQGIGSLQGFISNPLQAIQGYGTQLYQEAINPWVQLGKGGIGSLRAALDFNPATTIGSGFTTASDGYFGSFLGDTTSPFATSGSRMLRTPELTRPQNPTFTERFGPKTAPPAGATGNQPVLAAPPRGSATDFVGGRPVLAAPPRGSATDFVGGRYDFQAPAVGYDFQAPAPSAQQVMAASSRFASPLTVADPRYNIVYDGANTTVSPVAPPPYEGSIGANRYFYATDAGANTLGGVATIGALDQAKGLGKTEEEIAEDKGFFTENNINADMLNLDGSVYGNQQEAQLPTYDFEGVGQPGAYTATGGYGPVTGTSYPGFERGPLGPRVFGGTPVTLANPFDLSPYFQTPVFNEGGQVDAGQHKGFPFMDSLPAGMQSKFKAYESGTQSYTDSSGEQLEEGYTRVSGSDMEPVEERYVKTPVGIQEFFSRSPSGHYNLRA
jgi:hypothetical protein